MTEWRWDQGRNQYFLYENIQSVASQLVSLDGTSLARTKPDGLRKALEVSTGLEFKPTHYKVWRQYARVFECCMLAASVDNKLAVTNICRQIASIGDDRLDTDGYLSMVVPRFSYPYPAFDNYDAVTPQVFPFCAILKLLLSAIPAAVDASISVDDVAGKLIGNRITGTEPLEAYQQLTDTGHRLHGNSKRQLSELLMFVSQSSFLKWNQKRLFLDIMPGDTESFAALRSITDPTIAGRQGDQGLEIIALASDAVPPNDYSVSVTRKQPADVIFTEGKRLRMTHLRTERSPILRRALFASKSLPFICDICSRDLRSMYPWTENILEVHHLLPLSAALVVSERNTSLKDVVPVCPNCHRSVHIFYKKYLNDKNQSDFFSRTEALNVYDNAKSEVIQ